MTTPTYKAASDGFIIGMHYAKGDTVPLTELQAKYLTGHYGNAVYIDKPAAVAPATTAKTEPKPTPAKD